MLATIDQFLSHAPPLPRCLWCGRQFRPRTTGGSQQRFCSAEHRHEFSTAARRWAVTAIERRVIPVEAFRATLASAHADRCLFCGAGPLGLSVNEVPRRFCNAAHRHAYRHIGARWAARVLEAGLISASMIGAVLADDDRAFWRPGESST
jgi:hypothetical protein